MVKVGNLYVSSYETITDSCFANIETSFRCASIIEYKNHAEAIAKKVGGKVIEVSENGAV